MRIRYALRRVALFLLYLTSIRLFCSKSNLLFICFVLFCFYFFYLSFSRFLTNLQCHRKHTDIIQYIRTEHICFPLFFSSGYFVTLIFFSLYDARVPFFFFLSSMFMVLLVIVIAPFSNSSCENSIHK